MFPDTPPFVISPSHASGRADIGGFIQGAQEVPPEYMESAAPDFDVHFPFQPFPAL
jgi:hypothetical protein